MPYQLTWDDRLVLFDYYGEMTSQDILRSNRIVYGDSRFDRLRWQLVCVDRVNSVNFHKKDVQRIAYMDKAAALANARISVVFAGNSDLLQEIYSLYTKYIESDPWPVYYFESREAAMQYIKDSETESPKEP